MGTKVRTDKVFENNYSIATVTTGPFGTKHLMAAIGPMSLRDQKDLKRLEITLGRLEQVLKDARLQYKMDNARPKRVVYSGR